jgi:hypothetical protein
LFINGQKALIILTDEYSNSLFESFTNEKAFIR